MKLAKTRLFVAAAMLSAPLGVLVCNKMKDTSPIVKPVNEAIELERKSLQKKEGEFVKKLDRWVMWLDMVGSHLRDHENLDDPYLQLNFANQEFLDTRMGHCAAIVPPETALEKVVDEANRIVRSIVPPKKEKNDFHVEPSKDQVEAFIKLIKMADKVTPLVVLDDIHKNIEKRGQKLNRSKEDIAKSKEVASETFEIYEEVLKEAAIETPKLIQSLEKFNEKAKIENQPPYEPRWGLSLELLKSLKSIK